MKKSNFTLISTDVQGKQQTLYDISMTLQVKCGNSTINIDFLRDILYYDMFYKNNNKYKADMYDIKDYNDSLYQELARELSRKSIKNWRIETNV